MNSQITTDELNKIDELRTKLLSVIPGLTENSKKTIEEIVSDTLSVEKPARDRFGNLSILFGLQTSVLSVEEVGLREDGVISVLLYFSTLYKNYTEEEIKAKFGEHVLHIINGLTRVQELYKKNPSIESENFHQLLLSFAEDMRVILIMIADRVNLMRLIKDYENNDVKRKVSEEAAYLYAPLAHKLGLYKLKSELEDLSLKYLEHDAYYMIKDKLNATKKTRDAYIESFITPVAKRLEDAGLKFHIKGRTKSIHSIWQKMKKQRCEFEGIYDLFAIRIILDSPPDKEKMHCWQAYSVVTDMYQPNPKRLRDWLSVPKTNGYESLHITVLGPEKKWVEVQIRTERMDEIAEHGLAAHWRYKGIKTENGLDEWLNNIRSTLEAGSNNMQAIDHFKMDLYEDEVFVFTPRGDLYKFPKGATILDFAYRIHSRVGNQCVGAKINNRLVPFRTELNSGDQVEIITNTNQKPKLEWLSIVKTSHARAKIRLSLKEAKTKDVDYIKELLARRLKNRKIDLEEHIMSLVVKKLGYKEVSLFYKDIADGQLEPNDVIDKYISIRDSETNEQPAQHKSAEGFSFNVSEQAKAQGNSDVLTIGKQVKGIDYTLAKCCNPLYGDKIFGFVTVSGGIKIHRADCPNAAEMRRRFGYRVVEAKWSGKGNNSYSIPLRITGIDDMGIVNNITNIIQKEGNILLRSINIDSHDGLFRGTLQVQVDDNHTLDNLIKKLKNVKGVKSVDR
ncbi:MAG: bifunctional (p)ppGpp synthetase/guanosine-3',5'-bis(diphosphate) 3'-pyrophosphohydrolase [Prevotella sp.]|nr:bifunctional (p)ppGpp synthetase/guanosine-3',5'-bis(diphosphate) 3'-pyrophosphohydrolase [Prevotella sp.]